MIIPANLFWVPSEIHRTDDLNLTKLFRDDGNMLLNVHECSFKEWSSMNNFIKSCAHGEATRIENEDLKR